MCNYFVKPCTKILNATTKNLYRDKKDIKKRPDLLLPLGLSSGFGGGWIENEEELLFEKLLREKLPEMFLRFRYCIKRFVGYILITIWNVSPKTRLWSHSWCIQL